MNIEQVKEDFENGVLLGKETVRALINSALADSQRLDWLQENTQEFRHVQFDVDDGKYECMLTSEGLQVNIVTVHGVTIREVIDQLKGF